MIFFANLKINLTKTKQKSDLNLMCIFNLFSFLKSRFLVQMIFETLYTRAGKDLSL